MDLFRRGPYDEDHEAFRESVRRFLASEVAPHLEEWRSGAGVPDGVFTSLGEHGFVGTSVPEEYGGGGVDDPLFTAVLVEEVAAAGATSLAMVVAFHCGVVVPAVSALAESDERTTWLQGMASGQLLAVPVALGPDGRAGAVPAAGRAGLFLALREDGDALVVTPEQMVLAPVHLLGGLDTGSAADVRLAVDAGACRALPSWDRVGRDLDLWSAVVATAAARAAVDLAVAYARERLVFGRPLADFENTRFRLAEVGAEIAAARALVQGCLVDLASGRLDDELPAAARLVSSKVHDAAVDQAKQLHGGYGYMREYPVAHAFGDARLLRVVSAGLGEPRPLVARAVGL